MTRKCKKCKNVKIVSHSLSQRLAVGIIYHPPYNIVYLLISSLLLVILKKLMIEIGNICGTFELFISKNLTLSEHIFLL